ncbi:spermidine synthase [Nakamurella panacisegetis]|uniref:spermidine synthase n=1 Tax=Nakamurella panacisegetis TaxID=1090615 RepID=UPI000B81554E|nr:fused MFS/spermidine synthase [Nakamurella panacisegetis]
MNDGQVELLADDDRPGGWLLLLDRVRQSYVALDDPSYLEFPYVQALAEAVVAMPEGPLEAIHIGGGGATLPRWLAQVRPGSAQVVFEPHPELLRVVQSRLPVPPDSGIEFRPADGRRGLGAHPADSADVVVIDAFSGGRVPAELSTAEFFADVARVLRSTGLLLINTTAAAQSMYLRRIVAAVATQFAEIVVSGQTTGDVGNLVIVAGRAGHLPIELVLAEDGPLGPSLALSGPALGDFVGDVEPLTDASPMRSPIPPDATWRVGGD